MEEWRRHRERRKIAPFPFQSTEMSRGSSDGRREENAPLPPALSAMQLKFNAATRARRSMMEVHRMCIRSLVLYPFEEGALSARLIWRQHGVTRALLEVGSNSTRGLVRSD